MSEQLFRKCGGKMKKILIVSIRVRLVRVLIRPLWIGCRLITDYDLLTIGRFCRSPFTLFNLDKVSSPALKRPSQIGSGLNRNDGTVIRTVSPVNQERPELVKVVRKGGGISW